MICSSCGHAHHWSEPVYWRKACGYESFETRSHCFAICNCPTCTCNECWLLSHAA